MQKSPSSFFQHPSIEIVQIDGKGRGFRVKDGHSIKKGELLIREESHLEAAQSHNWMQDIYAKLAQRLNKDYPEEMKMLSGENDIRKIELNNWTKSWKSGCHDNNDDCECEDHEWDSVVEICFLISTFNHSCDPNADKTDSVCIECENVCGPDINERCANHKQVYGEVTALKNISSLEEICVTYLDFPFLKSMSTKERRQHLSNNWKFFCQCNRCNCQIASTQQQ